MVVHTCRKQAENSTCTLDEPTNLGKLRQDVKMPCDDILAPNLAHKCLCLILSAETTTTLRSAFRDKNSTAGLATRPAPSTRMVLLFLLPFSLLSFLLRLFLQLLSTLLLLACTAAAVALLLLPLALLRMAASFQPSSFAETLIIYRSLGCSQRCS